MSKLSKTVLAAVTAQWCLFANLPVGATEIITNDANGVAFSVPVLGPVSDADRQAAATPEKAATIPATQATGAPLPGPGPQIAVSGDSPVGSMGVLQAPPMSPLEGEVIEVEETASAPVVIDNDGDEATLQEEYNWKEIPDEQGRTRITAGARFPVSVSSALNSKTSKVGDVVEARLKVDLKIGGKLVASKGARVIGHVSSSEPARRILHAELSKKRWMRANGALGITFDEIITDSGEHLPLVAKPARNPRVVKNKHEGRVLGINDKGEVASPLSIQLKHQAAHLAIRGAASAGGVFSFGIVPVAYGVIGAINPSFAFLHPVGSNVRHRRLKGFAMGLVSGLPGGFLIADSIIKGVEAEIKPGDEFLAEFKQDFTGEPAGDAQLLPGGSTKVRGEVLPSKK